MQSGAAAAGFELLALFGRGVQQPGKIGEGDAELPSVGEFDPKAVGREPHPFGRSLSRQSAHSTVP